MRRFLKNSLQFLRSKSKNNQLFVTFCTPWPTWNVPMTQFQMWLADRIGVTIDYWSKQNPQVLEKENSHGSWWCSDFWRGTFSRFKIKADFNDDNSHSKTVRWLPSEETNNISAQLVSEELPPFIYSHLFGLFVAFTKKITIIQCVSTHDRGSKGAVPRITLILFLLTLRKDGAVSSGKHFFKVMGVSKMHIYTFVFNLIAMQNQVFNYIQFNPLYKHQISHKAERRIRRTGLD